MLSLKVIIDPKTKLSLSLYTSDSSDNLLLLENLVGTLAKYTSDGTYEPYLAEKWETVGTRWDFYLRDGLKDSHGKQITVSSYITSLNFVLKNLAKSGEEIPVFRELEGWNDFISNKSSTIFGIQNISDKVIRFSFVKNEQGFLEYISMPYYGYYSLDDFNSDGSWKNNHAIVSSAAYALVNMNDDEVILKKRSDWFYNNEGSPNEVMIKKDSLEAAAQTYKQHTLLWFLLARDVKLPDYYKYISTTPTVLTAIELSPYMDNIFSSSENRLEFFRQIRDLQKKKNFVQFNQMLAEEFYFASPANPNIFNESPEMKLTPANKKVKIKIAGGSLMPEYEKKYLMNLITTVLKNNDIDYEIPKVDRTKSSYIEDFYSNRVFDICIKNVDIGGKANPFVIGMMFCSKLGVSFPDPSKRICKLVEDFKHDLVSSEEFTAKFNEYYQEDASVLPMFIGGEGFIVTKDIKGEGLSPTIGIPRFDLIELE